MKKSRTLSRTRIYRIKEQGYFSLADAEITALAIGNRMAYQLCLLVMVIGVVLQNPYLIGALAITAFLSVVLPNHPFDLVYNQLVSKIMKRPAVPPRSVQLKFTCGIAAVWLSTISLLLFKEQAIAANIMAAALIGLASLVSFLDLCIPSRIYNALFGIKN